MHSVKYKLPTTSNMPLISENHDANFKVDGINGGTNSNGNVNNEAGNMTHTYDTDATTTDNEGDGVFSPQSSNEDTIEDGSVISAAFNEGDKLAILDTVTTSAVAATPDGTSLLLLDTKENVKMKVVVLLEVLYYQEIIRYWFKM